MADELFDPSNHNVSDVLAYLSQADAAEVQRVQAAEADGKARKGIAEWAPTEPPTTEQLLGDADPYELVRAKDQAGNEYTTSRIAALHARSTVLDKPAVDGWGKPYPTKTFLDLRAEEPAAAESQPSTDHTQE